MSVCLRMCTFAEPKTESDNSTMAVELPDGHKTGILERSSEFVELLTNVSSVLELLSQAAQSSLDERERQVELVAPVLKSLRCPEFSCTRH